MVSVVHHAALNGIDAFPVTVEAARAGRSRNSAGSAELQIIGLPDTAVREAAGRVRSAMNSCGFSLYAGITTVNLAPADRRKEGSAFDLPIFLSLISDNIEGFDAEGKMFIGELSLTGAVRPVRGVLSMASAARDAGFKEIYVPAENANEASAAGEVTVYAVDNVVQLYEHLAGIRPIEPTVFDASQFEDSVFDYDLDFADVKGQESARFALEVAAAGAHNLLMIGPPGSGKSMLAARLPSILPPQTPEEAVETTKIHSVAGILPAGASLLTLKPFRAPHHSLSPAGLAGGGKVPVPGEISLAHNGVLFLDELPEFDKRATEILRQPLEERRVSITRVNGKVTFPASFMLVCAMNPCRCGYYGAPNRTCTCSPSDRHAYITKLSGPLLDRIDIQIEVPALDYSQLSSTTFAEPSSEIRKRVIAARKFARERCQSGGDRPVANSEMDQSYLRKYCRLDEDCAALMRSAYERLGLSARGYDRILRLARTIADLDSSESVRRDDIMLAIRLRSLDRKYFR